MKLAKATRQRQRDGFTLVEAVAITIVIALLAGVLIRAVARQSQRAKRIACVNNLGMMVLSYRMGILEPTRPARPLGGDPQSALSAWRLFQSIFTSNVIGLTNLICPSDTRQAASSWAKLRNTNIGYFINLELGETFPQSILAGDRNITNGTLPTNGILTIKTNDHVGWTRAMHRSQGMVVLGAGSVQQMSNSRLAEHIRNSEPFRIALPE